MAQTALSSPTLASSIIETLKTYGVKRIFGIPGGGSSLALMEAAGRSGLEFVLTRSETAAAIMASVTGELTGSPGVVLTGIGPGATSAVNGIAYAYLEKSPVVIFTDGPASTPHQALDQNALFKPITKHQGWLRPESAPMEFEQAVRMAMKSPWGPVQLNLTAGEATTIVSGKHGPAITDDPQTATDAILEQASVLLANSRKPIIITGLEARHGDAPAALRRLADKLCCPVLASYKASGVLPASHPSFAGPFTGAVAESDFIHAADLIILFGFDPIEMIPGRWPYDCPILDLLPAETTPLPVEPTCRVVARLEETVDALLPLARQGDWTAGEIDAARHEFRQKLELRGTGHTAQTVVEAAVEAAPEGSRLTVDAGAHMFAALAFWPAEEPFGVLKSNGLSTMGYALPAAIASSLEEPTRPVISVSGDGGFMMCLAELATAVQYQCNITVLVINDAALSLIDIKQQRQQYESRGVRYPTIDLASCAEAMGCHAWRVEPGLKLSAILVETMAMPGPKVIDIVADADGYSAQLERLRG